MATFGFLVGRFLAFGAGFGAAYGTAVGIAFGVATAGPLAPLVGLYGGILGVFSGAVAGLLDGLVLGTAIACAIRYSLGITAICRSIPILAPFLTLIGLSLIRSTWGAEMAENFSFTLGNGFIIAIALLATVGSWHAGWIISRQFRERLMR